MSQWTFRGILCGDRRGRLSVRYPKLPYLPLCVDFAAPFSLPELGISANRRVVYFPGSTIGNFGPADAKVLLTQIANFAVPAAAS